MPFSVHIDHPASTLTLACWGEVTVSDFMEYERLYWGGSEHEGYHHIVDLRVADLKIDLAEGLMLATHATPTNPDAYSGARSAIVVANDSQAFLAEAYKEARHTMCHPKTREVGVFEDIEAAKAWIDESAVIYAS